MNTERLKRKIALGTVQLGLSYGINNRSGKPDEAEAHRILQMAAREGIALLDSAEAYGDSLRVIGSWLKSTNPSTFDVISKFIGGGDTLAARVKATLATTGQSRLYALMYHRLADYESGEYRNTLSQLKQEDVIQHIGISLYDDQPLERIIDDPDITVIQIPFHPWDASDRKRMLMARARAAGKEIHVRSVFFQGLFFKSPSELTGNLASLQGPLEAFQSMVKSHGMTVRQACLNFALHQDFIDRVVIGVETTEQLEQNMKSIMNDCPAWMRTNLNHGLKDTTLLNPANWKPDNND